MPCCKDCRFIETGRDQDETIGDCRRYPPVFNNKATKKNGGDVSLSCIVPEWWCSGWSPVVNLDDWCGEWQPIAELVSDPVPQPDQVLPTKDYESSGHLCCTFQTPLNKILKALDQAGVKPTIILDCIPYYGSSEAYEVLRGMKPIAKKAVTRKLKPSTIIKKSKVAKKKPINRKTRK